MNVYPQCAKCPGVYCSSASIETLDKSKLPEYCPMTTSPTAVEMVVEKYRLEEVRKIYVPAARTEKEAYEHVRGVRMAVRPRIREIVEFAKLLGFRRIGMAFCAGLKNEAERIAAVFELHGLEVASVACSCGAVDKTRLSVPKEYKIGGPEKYEAACNPILQSQLLNDAETEINVIVGLCVGHDILFTMNSEAPVTTLIVKDRVTGHNPTISLFCSYLKRSVEKAQPT